MSETIKHELPTYGQLERELFQTIYQLYRKELECSPSKITCEFISNNLAIVIEDSLTTIEKTLLKENKIDLVKKVNLAINNIIKSKLKILIEQVLAVEVCDILFDSSLETQHTGAIVILSQLPVVRPRQATTKFPKSQRKNEYSNESNFNHDDKNLNLAVIMLYFLCLEPDKDMRSKIKVVEIIESYFDPATPRIALSANSQTSSFARDKL